MELIPTSHLYPHISLFKLQSFIKNRKIISVNPGDLLIFYATMLHKGIFYEKTQERRLIQLFDCVPNNELLRFKKSILHIPCGNNCSSSLSSFLIGLHKFPVCSEIVNYIGFYTAAKGYGAYYNSLNHITNDKEIKYLSSESNRGRIEPKGGYEQQNLYVLFTDGVKDIDSSNHDSYLFFTFVIDIILFSIILLVIIYFIVRVIYYLLPKINKRKIRSRKLK
jgi:hypothetical protein